MGLVGKKGGTAPQRAFCLLFSAPSSVTAEILEEEQKMRRRWMPRAAVLAPPSPDVSISVCHSGAVLATLLGRAWLGLCVGAGVHVVVARLGFFFFLAS